MSKNPSRIYEYLILTPTEERILRFLISQDHGASVSHISRAIKLARTSIYNAIDSLLKKDLLTKDGFSYDLTDKQWRPRNQEKSDPRKQIDALMQEMLCLKRGEIIYSIESDEEIKELFKSKTELLNWQRAVAKKGIVLKGIGTINALNFIQSMLDRNSDLSEAMKKRSGSSRFINEELEGPCTLAAFRDSVIFFSRTKSFFHRINDKNVARFIQMIVDSLADLLEYRPIV